MEEPTPEGLSYKVDVKKDKTKEEIKQYGFDPLSMTILVIDEEQPPV